ncbi:zinc-binding dehydrogenase [Afifella sp. IM 167]|uniref:zinc-dependent alcohol dehydrogenase n=1 Tax=Afifella sp. IM 167 TaxID=2033586 RepID=UPI001CCE0A68|nr:alcohol dehydrogenase catalytic domain-containing protein [Afifella sp. IM 167]MBZ8134063.1 galactitol-1-phosphate 5-dehydrogenase [Afifella sp. IM 167]
MKALIYTGPETLAFGEAADPRPGNDEVVVGVDAVGICGSDMHAYLGHDERRPAPLTLGHEAAGVILEGPGEGRRVTVNPLVTCMACPACLSGRTNLCPDRQILSMPPRQGAFAERIVIPERNLLTVPEGFALDKAALCEPLACSWHAVKLAAASSFVPPAAASALVIGGGPIGIGAALSLAAFGAGKIAIVEPNALRRPVLEAAGDFSVVASVEAGAFFDIVVDAYGGEASRAVASEAVRPGGVVVHVGLASASGGVNVRRVTLQEVSFLGSYCYTMTDFAETFAAMVAGRLGPLDWFDARPLAEGGAAFADIRAGCNALPKIILRPAG